MPRGTNPKSKANLQPRVPSCTLDEIIAHVREVTVELGHVPKFREWNELPHPPDMTYANISRRFTGGFREAVSRAGFVPRPRGDYERSTPKGKLRYDRRLPNRQMITGGK